ncbi:predicted protein [Postia placenta Mad-698-R]|nr:predicted protein [Postia placenta Mad-698-R]
MARKDEGNRASGESTPKPSPVPIFNRNDADIILRSANQVDFRTHRLILSMASPFFVDMTLDIARAVLEAALKYDIDKVISCIPLALHAFIPTEPLRVYALACRINAEPLARCAAKDVAIREFTFLRCVPELKDIPGGCYYRLVQYRARGVEQEAFCSPSVSAPISATEDDNGLAALSTSQTHGTARTLHPAALDTSTLDDVACTPDPLPPFDAADADVELVTSDGMRLRVYRSIISLISQTLKDLLDVSEASASVDGTGSLGDEPRKSMLVVPIVETSTIMQPLLRLCYPIGIPQQDDVELLVSLLPSAEKYKMERAIWTIQSRWADFAVVQPLRALLLAAARQWVQPAMDAIKQLLKHTIEELQSIYVADLETIPANYYRLVFQYHKRCSDAITSVGKSSHSWLSRDVRLTGCKDCRGPFGLSEEPRWLSDYVAKAVDMLIERPSSHTITEGQGFQTLIELATVCSGCRNRIDRIQPILQSFAKSIDKRLEKVTGFFRHMYESITKIGSLTLDAF